MRPKHPRTLTALLAIGLWAVTLGSATALAPDANAAGTSAQADALEEQFDSRRLAGGEEQGTFV